MSTRRTIRAIAPGAVRPGRMLPSFSAGSCCLSAPEGRLGVCAWALRGFAEHQEPQSASDQSASAKREGPFP